MDYKYIEQLIDQYFQGTTSLEEERILRSFFSQSEIPHELEQYRPLFVYQLQKESLGNDFDERILAMTKGRDAKLKVMVNRLMPLFKAAAIVAIVLTLGNAAQAPWHYGWDNPQDEYVKYHNQPSDSLQLLTPVQAENLADTAVFALPKTP